MKYCFGAVFLFALCACSSAPVSQNALNSALAENESYVVFDGSKSYLIGPSEKGYEVNASFGGAVVGSGSNLWMYNLAESMEPEADCSCVMEAMMADQEIKDSQCTSTVAKERAVLTRLSDSELVYPFEVQSSEESESSSSFQIVGQWGDLLLMESCTDQYSCGAAHPWGHCSSTSFDLKSGELVEIASWIGKVDPTQAYKEIREHDPEFDSEELEVSTARVVFSDGDASVRALMSGPTCYACSDGNWSAYTNSGWSPTSHRESLPAPVASFFAARQALPIVFFRVDDTNRVAISPLFANESPPESE